MLHRASFTCTGISNRQDRVSVRLTMRDGDRSDFSIGRGSHRLQTALPALKDDRVEADVACALLNNMGDLLA